jgi:uncharacterized OB-fold protein
MRTLEPSEKYTFSGRGEVFAWAKERNMPAGFNGPYFVALVKLEEGPLVTTQLTDMDSNPVIGEAVEMVTRKLYNGGGDKKGVIPYGFKFRRPIKRS